MLYAGYRFDPESGLYQVRHRHYHPTLGRWVQRDPIGYHDGMGLYQYVASVPTTKSDPLGLQSVQVKPEDYKVDPAAGDADAYTRVDLRYSGVNEKKEATIVCVCQEDKKNGTLQWECRATWTAPKAYCEFNKAGSSQRTADTLKNNPALLNHEQGHAEICEMYKRKLQGELNKAFGGGEDKEEQAASALAWNDLLSKTISLIDGAIKAQDKANREYDNKTMPEGKPNPGEQKKYDDLFKTNPTPK